MANNRNDWSDLTNQQRSKARNEQTQKARNKTQRQRAEQRKSGRSDQTNKQSRSVHRKKRVLVLPQFDKAFAKVERLRLPKGAAPSAPNLSIYYMDGLDPSTLF